jgi:hypothetical protein
MPSDERDQQFERALQRHLRAEAGDPACLDVETLAAYHQRTLSTEELTTCKEHISSCPRCQEILTLVEATNAVALHDWETKEAETPAVPELRASASGARFGVAEDANLIAAPREVKEISPPVVQRTVGRPKAWRWVVPAGALAAGLLVFVAVKENKSRVSAPLQSVQVAENRKDTVLPMSPEKTASAQSAFQKDKNIEIAPPKIVPETRAKQQSDSSIPSDQLAAYLNGKKSAEATKARSVAQDQSAELDSAVNSKEARLESRAQQALRSQNNNAVTNMSSGVANAPAPAPARSGPPQSTGTNTAVAGIAGTLEKSENSANGNRPPASVNETAEVRAVPVTSAALSANYAQLREIAAANPHVILAPDGKRAWRVGAAGIIESSDDSGITWKAQKSQVNVDLSAGSAASDRVCWVVGKAGTILLTTNGGKHWKLIVSPLVEDLGGVHAVDAKHASIGNVGNQKSFETADGGMTWTPAANE